MITLHVVLLCTALISTAGTVVLAVVWRAERDRALRDWMLGYASLALGAGLRLAAGPLPEVVAVVGGNLLILLTLDLIRRGLRFATAVSGVLRATFSLRYLMQAAADRSRLGGLTAVVPLLGLLHVGHL